MITMRIQVFLKPPLMLFLLNFLSMVVNFASGQCVDNQKNPLLELRETLTYDSSLSTKLVKWNEGTDCCLWGGVTCDSAGHVVGLDLSHESISGGINDTSSLFNLQFLQSLNLAENFFDSAQLPPKFEKLGVLSYLNLSDSGFAGQIPSGFPSSLVTLDLSSNIFTHLLRLENPSLKIFVQNLTRLRELHLDGVNISAEGYDWCQALSSSLPGLQILSLSNCFLSGPLDSSLVKLMSLSVIYLDKNTLSAPFPEFLGDFSNLTVLSLGSCNLSGQTPQKLFQVPTLQIIDLSNNRILGGSLPEFPPNGSLQSMLLSYTEFSGNLPDSIGNLRMLVQVDLRACNFTGSIPSAISSLTQLVSLDLSINGFSGSVPPFNSSKYLNVVNLRHNNLTGGISSFHVEALDNLEFLDLSENSLDGQIPPSLFSMPSLKVLRLSYNQFSGQISELPNISSSPLEVLDLNSNNLEGPVPDFLFELRNLTSLTLSWNQLNGSLEFIKFRKLENLVNLDLSYNYLSVKVSISGSELAFLPLFGSLILASCKLQEIPFLKNQSRLMMLDLSNNQIAGEIPNWIWETGNGSLRFLNLSYNQLTSIQEPYTFPNLHFLDLHSNFLIGQLPSPPLSAAFVDFSRNNFTSSIPEEFGNHLASAVFVSIANNYIFGSIPESICNASQLEVLDLSNNSLDGIIPSCLMEKSNTLGVLNLGRNNLSGNIPRIFMDNCNLDTLDLSWNVLEGQVPESLANCNKLEVLNLGNNKINDLFPCWLSSLASLHVLVLRSNRFHGNISCPDSNYSWSDLQIIDLSSNYWSGDLPEALFSHLKAMMANSQLDLLKYETPIGNQIYYQDTVMVTLKGQDVELEKIRSIFTSIDFSSNNFQGNLPQAVGDLKSIYLLNFSHNALVGQIPPSIGNLKQLESLDLSFNQLSGQIPWQISSLTFLSFLNLAYNQLVGRIPKGNQMQTFPDSWFEGNQGLCGFPLNRTCSSASPPEFPASAPGEKRYIPEKDIYASATIGFAVGLGVIFGSFLFSKRWRKCYNDRLDRLILRILSSSKPTTRE